MPLEVTKIKRCTSLSLYVIWDISYLCAFIFFSSVMKWVPFLFGMQAQAVREADKFRLKTPIANKARKLLERFVEERMDSRTKKMLQDAKREKNRAKLEEAVKICDREGFVTKLVRECRELLEKIYDADDALKFVSSDTIIYIYN